MHRFFVFLLSRARERSTWIGIISLATALGIYLTPEQTEAVIAAGISLAGLISVLMPDKNKDTPPDDAAPDNETDGE